MKQIVRKIFRIWIYILIAVCSTVAGLEIAAFGYFVIKYWN